MVLYCQWIACYDGGFIVQFDSYIKNICLQNLGLSFNLFLISVIDIYSSKFQKHVFA